MAWVRRGQCIWKLQLAVRGYSCDAKTDCLSRVPALCGISKSGIGFAENRTRQGLAINRASQFDLLALSVEMPVFAYICRYNLEISTKAIRPRSVGTQRERRQMGPRL